MNLTKYSIEHKPVVLFIAFILTVGGGFAFFQLGQLEDPDFTVKQAAIVTSYPGASPSEVELEVSDRIEAAVKPSRKLLGATIIGSVAFLPIFLSQDDTGEYCQALFVVVAAALLLSWLVSVTFTAVQCAYMLPEQTAGGKDPYGSSFYNRFRSTIHFFITRRWLTVIAITGMLALSIANFGKIPEMFFPQSDMAKFMIDYWMPEGTRIERVSDDLITISDHLLADDRIESVTSFAGGGSPRFYLPVEPADNNLSYGHLIVDVKDFEDIENIFTDLASWFTENFPDAMVPLRRFPVGPGKNWEFEIRLSGPPMATADELRFQGQRVLDIVQASPATGFARQDWRNRVQIISPHYSQSQGRWSGVTRGDLAKATKRAFDGQLIGVYREGDNLLPILLRDKPSQKGGLTNFGTLPIKPTFSTDAVPLAQVVDGVSAEWVDPFHLRYNRLRTIRIQANQAPAVLLSEIRQDLTEAIFALDFPEGWRLSWGGITEKEIESQKALAPGAVPAITIMMFVLIWLFNSFKPAIIVLLIAPLALVGMVSGLLLTNTAFGFMALLGAMGLSGMMMKNAIVLLDEIKQNQLGGMSKYLSIQEAAVARLRAVSVTATKILSLLPWQSMYCLPVNSLSPAMQYSVNIVFNISEVGVFRCGGGSGHTDSCHIFKDDRHQSSNQFITRTKAELPTS